MKLQNKPEGSNWGTFGEDDRVGRMNLIDPARRLAAMNEVRQGRSFCLSLPLDRPGGNVFSASRKPPELFPVLKRDGQPGFNLANADIHPDLHDVNSDDGVILYNQYSTHWDSLAHRGMVFDADGDGVAEHRFYNGFQIADAEGKGRYGDVGSISLSIDNLAQTCVQGRGVLVDLRHHFGDERTIVDFDKFRQVLDADGIEVAEGDILCLHTGLSQLIIDADGAPPPALKQACAVLDGYDDRLLEWITHSGISAIVADNLAIEASSSISTTQRPCDCDTNLPLHRHCLVKLGIHLGELWYLTELAAWLRANNRHHFLLTAPPIRLPGAAGAPVTPVATV